MPPIGSGLKVSLEAELQYSRHRSSTKSRDLTKIVVVNVAVRTPKGRAVENEREVSLSLTSSELEICFHSGEKDKDRCAKNQGSSE